MTEELDTANTVARGGVVLSGMALAFLLGGLEGALIAVTFYAMWFGVLKR